MSDRGPVNPTERSLARMRRRHGRYEFLRLVDALRAGRPDLAITSEDAEWSEDGEKLTLVLHNVGNNRAQSVLVRLIDSRGSEGSS